VKLGLEGKVVLVSGSYRGTGAGTAKVFAEEGALVGVHGHELGQADDVVADITANKGSAVAVHGDLGTSEGADDIVSQVEATYGPVDVLVNNHGAPGRTDWAQPAEVWKEGWETNVLTGIRLTQRVLPSMRERGWGRIIFLGTVGTERPSEHNPDYYGSKGSLPVVVRSLAKELRGSGVTANLVSPGMIATSEVREMLQRRAARHNIHGWDEVQRWALENSMPNLTGRIPDPEDIGRYVVFVASDVAWHLTGIDFKADGGAIDA
jgi:3-oxoacyl-[acyl-carrier protein] reductase|tara:strand:- start:654 stop:1445 length:792 start_codon:yes stop_codon:yes gene_type:complete